MTFISYAQTYEDVMLARAFAGIARGFYIDVGAQDPRFDSVTKAFYDQGWHGINLEPVEHWHRKLVLDRPRDINLCLAAGDHEGSLEFHETDESGLSTSSADIAGRHRAEGIVLRTRQVPVSTLDAICRRHDVAEVHFLKVDVEGAEAEVLRGLDLTRLRPWIILVEATEPNSRVSTHARWESLVTDHDYRMVYQDGLNRFYLAREHEDLAPAFDAPPNIFDGFVRREQVDLEADLLARMAEVDALSHRRAAHIDELTAALATVHADAARMREGLDAAIVGLQAQAAAGDAERARLQGLLEDAGTEQLRLHQEFARLSQAHAADLASLRQLGNAHAQLRAQADRLQARLEQSERGLSRLSRELLEAQAGREAAAAQARIALEAHAATLAAFSRLQAEHAQVLASRSWRVTVPLRAANAWIARLRGRLVRRADKAPAARIDGARDEPEPQLPLTEDAEAILAAHPVQPTDPADGAR